jgi:hypothetical protein
MTAQKQIEAASSFAQLWQELLPNQELPTRQQFLMWAGIYTDEQISRGITRAAAKSRRMDASGTPMSADDCARYATSVMKNELLGIQRHEPSTRWINQ